MPYATVSLEYTGKPWNVKFGKFQEWPITVRCRTDPVGGSAYRLIDGEWRIVHSNWGLTKAMTVATAS